MNTRVGPKCFPTPTRTRPSPTVPDLTQRFNEVGDAEVCVDISHSWVRIPRDK